MLQKKVCMVGAFAVGKTSLVQRLLSGIFSEKYLTTVGVKIDRATVQTSVEPVNLVLWDIAGQDGLLSFNENMLQGASGLIFVVDSTRRLTLDHALALRERVVSTFGEVPSIAFLNKVDLKEQWEFSEGDLARLAAEIPCVIHSSAKTGEAVEAGFRELAELIITAGGVRLQRRT